jgi:putative ABC transport system permease protein
MDTLLHDLRYAARMLWRTPGVSLIAVLTLALGIGANTAIFSVVNAVLLRPLPYAHPDRLVLMWEYTTRLPDLDRMFVSYPDYLDWRDQNQSFEHLAVFRDGGANLTGGDGPERIQVGEASASIFPILGVPPLVGRGFLPEEDRPGAGLTAVISYGLWQRRFGGDEGLVGQAITLDGEAYTVVGVMPQGFHFPEQTPPIDVWVPVGLNAASRGFTSRGNHPGLLALGLLKPGVTFEQARGDMARVMRSISEQHPGPAGDTVVRMTTLTEEIVGDVRPALLVLLGGIGFVLLIACVNVANLLLARALGRQREIAIRAALGASRARVIRQLLTESAMLAIVGGVAGLAIAVWGVDFLIAVSPESIPRLAETSVDGTVLAFTAAVSLLTGLAFGLVPALQVSRPDLNEALKEGSRGATDGVRRNRVRTALVVTELALALVLLVGAGLMVRSFARLLDVDPGFNPEGVLAATIPLPSAKYPEDPQQVAFFERVRDRVRALPGVVAAGAVSNPPISGGAWQTNYAVEGREEPDEGAVLFTDVVVASPDYFRVMEIPVRAGRDFSDRDRADGLKVALIDETMARTIFAGEDPIGKRIGIDHDDDGNRIWREIVGVVGHVKHYGLDKASRSQVYVPHAQIPLSDMTLVVRTAGDPAALAPALRAEVLAVDADQPLSYLGPMREVVADSLAQRRFSMALLGIFALVALVLSAVGIYGVMAYAVTQRTHEIGIRMALGAGRGDVIRMVVRHGMALALAGVAAGAGMALVMSRLISGQSASLLFEVSPTDPPTFIGVALLLAAVAFLACYLPARRAARVDPMIALRYE